jgi:phthalate 4,5-cis-dihydrodiol dehydrogenase
MKLGVIGLGRAFTLMAPTFRAHPAVDLVAATDPRIEARQRFEGEFGAKTYRSSDGLCDDPDVEAVYIASPHQDHARHACKAAARGKHVLVEKPMAVTLAECDAMIAATKAAGVQLVVGHSHSFDAPIARAREIVASGALGAVRMVTALNYTDFLYRPRRPEELDTAKGGGVLYSQAAHQVDVVRLLVGSRVTSVRASAGAWDPARPTEGAYGAHLSFENGAFATLTYSGYGRFDSDAFCGDIGELGQRKESSAYGGARRMLASAADADAEAALKQARNYGGEREAETRAPVAHEHFGLIVVSCERGDLRPMPTGVHVYDDEVPRFEPLPVPTIPRREVIDELLQAIASSRPAPHDGKWGRDTLQVCIAMLQSARENREVILP